MAIDHLVLEFDPKLFTAPFLTFNMPSILSRIRRMTLIKKSEFDSDGQSDDGLMTSAAIYCPECAVLLQYTRSLEELTFNFPLSSAYYPLLSALESLKMLYRVEQPFVAEHSLNTPPSAYSQNIVTFNARRTTLISNVKLQRSMMLHFAPSMTSLHLHGAKGLQQLSLLFADDQDQEALPSSVHRKNKVFFGLKELCIHCSAAVHRFVTDKMAVVPQLKRLQVELYWP